MDEGALGAQQGQVVAQRQLGARDGADDEVEGARVVLGPVLIVVGRYVLVGAHLEDVVALAVGARDADDLIRAEGFGEEHAEVAQAADADDADTLAGAAAVVLEGRVDGDATWI